MLIPFVATHRDPWGILGQSHVQRRSQQLSSSPESRVLTQTSASYHAESTCLLDCIIPCHVCTHELFAWLSSTYRGLLRLLAENLGEDGLDVILSRLSGIL